MDVLTKNSGGLLMSNAMAKYWRLTEEEKSVIVGSGSVDRIKSLFRIHCFLYRLFENQETINEWLREPNEYINGKVPLEVLKEGSIESILFVEQFLSEISGN